MEIQPKEVYELIRRQLDLVPSDEMDKLTIIEHLTKRVAGMLDREPDLLWSYLYRLDVAEEDIKNTLFNNGQSPIAEQLALLIWNRQVQRMKTKRHYSQKS